MARLLGWKAAHFRPAQTSKGWRTPVEADGAGWPDLTLVRDRRILFVELKAKGKRPTEAQLAWLDALDSCYSTRSQVWCPSDLPRIEETLRYRPPEFKEPGDFRKLMKGEL